MLLIPLFSTDLRSGVISKWENRMLADRLPLSVIKKHPRHYIRIFERWFNDHVGFRETLINLYRKINGPQWSFHYQEGGLSYTVGKEGHHFFSGTNHALIAKFQGRAIFSDEQLRAFAQKLSAIKNYLDKEGIPLIVMFCTTKETIYPEYYPETILRGPEPVQLDIITDYLKENTSVDVFSIRQALMAQKDRYLLYPKAPPGDLAHYNEIAAFFAYRELMKHINVHFPEIIPYTTDDIIIECDENGTADVTLKEEITYKKSNDSPFNDLELPNSDFNEVFENSAANPLTILLLRDSYAGIGATYFSRYIAQHFNETIMTHFLNTNNLKQYIDTFHPDIVVFESCEFMFVPLFQSLLELNL
ncbi:MAG: hypothetical protein LBG07_09650 [Treponema sp.]|nr:hypothetical protein [Treponema sp.]